MQQTLVCVYACLCVCAFFEAFTMRCHYQCLSSAAPSLVLSMIHSATASEH